jgi:hypothetical protein
MTYTDEVYTQQTIVNKGRLLPMSDPLKRVPYRGLLSADSYIDQLAQALDSAIDRTNEQANHIARLEIRIDDLLARYEGHVHAQTLAGGFTLRPATPPEGLS